jgi:hypothetical protein
MSGRHGEIMCYLAGCDWPSDRCLETRLRRTSRGWVIYQSASPGEPQANTPVRQSEIVCLVEAFTRANALGRAVDMLCERLSLATPQPRPYHFSDGIDGTFQRLDESLQFAHRIRAWSKSHLRQGSAVAGLIDARSQTLETDLDTLRYELHEMGSSIANGVPAYIGELLGRIKRCIAVLTELVDFYGNNREQGRSDALDALFASQFILDIDERTGYPKSLPNQQGLVKMAIDISETLGNTSLAGASPVPQVEAVRSFEEHRYVTTC